MARLARENELSNTKIYNISDYNSSLSAKCVDFTYLSELSITSTATTAHVYTGSSSSKIAIYKQFNAQPLTASSWNIDCDVYFGEDYNGAACEIVIAGNDMGYNQMVGKYFVPDSISGSIYYGEQSSYVNDYYNKLLITSTIRGEFTITNTIEGVPYGTFHASGNTGVASSYIGVRIGSVANTQKYCHISGTSKTQGLFYQLYNETGLNYNTQLDAIAFGYNRTGDFILNQLYNTYGYAFLVWLNSGSNMNAGPGLYWRFFSDSTEVYVKARVENRRYNGSIAYLTGKLYMPVHVIAMSNL